MGSHATKMYHITSAIKAFQKDLKDQGVSEKVMTITMSEFGRRILSNGSYGTDHGKGGAWTAFGDKINAGVFGTNPDMNKSDIDLQFDYRQLYAGILHDWFGVEKSVINKDVLFKDFFNATDEQGNLLPDVEITNDKITGNRTFKEKRYNIQNPVPNPAHTFTRVKVNTISPETMDIQVIDKQGTTRKKLNATLVQGENQLSIDLSSLKVGLYFLQFKSNHQQETKKIIIE